MCCRGALAAPSHPIAREAAAAGPCCAQRPCCALPCRAPRSTAVCPGVEEAVDVIYTAMVSRLASRGFRRSLPRVNTSTSLVGLPDSCQGAITTPRRPSL